MKNIIGDSADSGLTPLYVSDDDIADRGMGRITAPKILVWFAVGLVLYVGKPAFAPLLFAVLFAMLLSPLVDLLQRYHVPRMIGSILAVGILIAGLAAILDAAWSPALKWIDNAPAVLQNVEQKVRPLQRIVGRIESVTIRASAIANTHTANSNDIGAVGIDTLAATRTVLIDTGTVSILTVFLLWIGARTLRRIESVPSIHSGHVQCIRIVEAVRGEFSRYFSALALINVGVGIVVTGVMSMWGLPSPWLWGIMAAILNFIPYVGPTITLCVLMVVSLASFEGYAVAIGVASSFLLIVTIEGQLVQPLLVGYRLNINPIILFVAIWLGGWFWGIAGILLATPVLITCKEIANRQPGESLVKAILNGQTSPIYPDKIVFMAKPDQAI